MTHEELEVRFATANIVLDCMYNIFKLLDQYEDPPYLSESSGLDDEAFEKCTSVLIHMDDFLKETFHTCDDYTSVLAKSAVTKYLVICYANAFYFKMGTQTMNENIALQYFKKTSPSKQDTLHAAHQINETTMMIHDNDEIAEASVSEFLEHWIKT